MGCPQQGRRDSDRSAAFLTFIRRTQFQPSISESDRLFFRLTNNTCWPIWLDMSGTGEPRYGDIRLYYLIEDKGSGSKIAGKLYCHVCSTNPVGSGKSITFSIPYEQADRGALMRIRFEFEWDR